MYNVHRCVPSHFQQTNVMPIHIYTAQWRFFFCMDARVSIIILTLSPCLKGIRLYKTGLNQMDAYTAVEVRYTYILVCG